MLRVPASQLDQTIDSDSSCKGGGDCPHGLCSCVGDVGNDELPNFWHRIICLAAPDFEVDTFHEGDYTNKSLELPPKSIK